MMDRNPELDRPLARRTVLKSALKGFGAAVALPMFDSLSPLTGVTRGLARAAGAAVLAQSEVGGGDGAQCGGGPVQHGASGNWRHLAFPLESRFLFGGTLKPERYVVNMIT